MASNVYASIPIILMATVQTSFVETPKLFSFDGLDLIDDPRTQVPRAELIFAVKDGSVTLSGAGDVQRVVVSCELPRNFAYVLTDVFLRLKCADVTNWQTVGEIAVSNSDASDRDYLASQQLVKNGLIDKGLSVVSSVWTPLGPLLKAVIIPVDKAALATVNLIINNDTEQQVVGTLNSFVRLLQYDILQAHHIQVNTATLVR